MPENVSNTSQFEVYPAPADETPAQRYNRDYAQMGKTTVPEPGIPDDRADRQLHQQDEERSSRLYVDYATGDSATGHDDAATDDLIARAKQDRSNTSLFETVTPAPLDEQA